MNPADVMAELVAIRKRRGMKQSSIARRLGVAPSRVSAIESLRHSPSLQVVVRYAQAVGAQIHVTPQVPAHLAGAPQWVQDNHRQMNP